jgi:hypothetical protein
MATVLRSWARVCAVRSSTDIALSEPVRAPPGKRDGEERT